MTDRPAPSSRATARATFGGGCFWCTEAVFERLRGVVAVTSGYAGGHVPNPSYREICGKRTGHAEVVQVVYRPEEVSYDDLLAVFFATHDPTTPNQQGADRGPQYRSIILHHDDAQRDAARAFVEQLERDAVFARPIVTEIEPLEAFYPAEAEHQDFYRRNSEYGYCRVVIDPKLDKLRARHADLLAG